MKTGFITIILSLCLPFVLTGQTEAPDTLSIGPVASSDTLNLEYRNALSSFDTHYNDALIRMFPDTIVHITGPEVNDLRFVPGEASIASWRGGQIAATGAVATMPGLMGVERGAIGIGQQFGRFSIYGGGIVTKYGFYRGLHTQYGLTGELTYSISPNISVTGFGSYYFGQPPFMANGMIMAPSIAGYYGVSTFGGFVNLQANDRFGVEVGAQAVQQIGTRRYDPEPMVTPYVNIGRGKAKVHIGLPVGQILYGILRSRR